MVGNTGRQSSVLAILLFVFCAVPGVFLFLFGSIFLAAVIMTPSQELRFPNVLYSLVASIIGMALVLIGLRLWRRWMYALVFVSLTVSLAISSFAGYVGMILGTSVSTFLVLHYVRAFYRKKDAAG